MTTAQICLLIGFLLGLIVAKTAATFGMFSGW